MRADEIQRFAETVLQEAQRLGGNQTTIINYHVRMLQFLMSMTM